MNLESKKTNIPSEQKQRQYGFFTMFALIVGTVIGAGIYFKNTSIMNSTNSAVLSLLVWIVVSVVVIFMVLALIEATSSTARSGETGTIGNWMSKFYNPKVGKVATWYFILFYFPSLLAALLLYTTDQVGQGVVGWITAGGNYLLPNTQAATWTYFLAVFGISLVILFTLSFLINKSKKWGENFQRVTLVIKMIPIAFILALFFVVVVAPGLRGNINQTPAYANNAPLLNIWSPGLKNQWSKGGNLLALGFVMALPAVMFAFDGFIYAGALQNEAKTKKTFRLSLFSGIVFIAVIYILFSWAIYALSNGTGYTIFNVLFAIFPNQPWLALTIDLIVGITILGGFNGFYILSTRNVASLSEKDVIIDKNGKFLKRNKKGIPEFSGWIVMLIVLAWLLLETALNALWTASDLYWQIAPTFNAATMNINGISTTGGASYTGGISHAWSSVGNTWAYVDTGNAVYSMHATDGIGEIVVVYAFILYTLIVFGAVMNRSDRFKTDVAVDKVSGFHFYAWFSIIAISVISIINIVALGYEAVVAPIWIIDWFWTISCLVFPFIFFYIYEKRINSCDKSIFENKKLYKDAYRELLTLEEYVARNNHTIQEVNNDNFSVTKIQEVKQPPIRIKTFKRVNYNSRKK